MILLPRYSGKTIFILGLGKTGLAAAESFRASGATLWGWDDGAAARQAAASLLTLTPPDEIPPCDGVFVSPGIPDAHPALFFTPNIRRLNDVDLFYEAHPAAHYIAITGTNGKSTTTALMAHVLESAGVPYQMGGNIGVPVLSLNPPKTGEKILLELSSYQLDLMKKARIHTAALLNITPDHLERHGTMNHYAAAKKKIFAHQCADDHAIIALDDAYCRTIYQDLLTEGGRHVLPLSTEHPVSFGVFVQEGMLYDALTSGVQRVVSLQDCPRLPGQHNAQNAAAVHAMARAEGLEITQITAALKTFPGLAHRQEWIAQDKGIVYINDSKATNMDATAWALSSYDRIFWILGGKPKDDDLTPLASYYPRIEGAYCIGDAGASFHRQLQAAGVKSVLSETLTQAVTDAQRDALNAGKGGVVLLSPACASFDQFDNYEHRGDVFRRAVLALVGPKAC
jgi:UDP-N-acetylmuramoylalanine--D-glutamate ligase